MRRNISQAEFQRIRDNYERERKRFGVGWGECFCGCGKHAPLASQTVSAWGWIKGEPKRFVRHHHIRRLPPTEHGVNKNNGYCECGCGEKTRIATETNRIHGTIKDQPVKFRKGHSLRKNGRDYEVDSETGCWVWKRATLKAKCDRYGQIWHNGRKQYAHRVYYERKQGPIPKGWQIHHQCVEFGFGTTLCVNPAHLTAVSNADNSRRSKSTKLSMDDVIEIRRMLDAEGYTQKEIAEVFGVHPNHISSINTGHRWAYHGA